MADNEPSGPIFQFGETLIYFDDGFLAALVALAAVLTVAGLSWYILRKRRPSD